MIQHPVYRFDDFVVYPEAWRLTRGGQEIHLKPVALKLLIYLIANRGRLVTREETAALAREYRGALTPENRSLASPLPVLT